MTLSIAQPQSTATSYAPLWLADSRGPFLAPAAHSALPIYTLFGILPPEVRRRIDVTPDHWLWTGAITGGPRGGYGNLEIGKRCHLAHRVIYTWLAGPVPDGLVLDHLCSIRRCVYPPHMEPCTVRDNLLRSPRTLPGINARKTACVRGHVFSAANTYVYPNGGRACRQCRRKEAAMT